MKKIEANSLEEAYNKACREFGCSIRELKYEIIQYPQKGVFGLFAKKAIIVATQNAQIEIKRDDKPKQELESSLNIHNQNSDLGSSFSEDEFNSLSSIQQKPSMKGEPSSQRFPQKEFIYETDDRVEFKSEIVDSFFSSGKRVNEVTTLNSMTSNNNELAKVIETQLKDLISKSCFNIDTVEVDVKNNVAFIFVDGEDAALLIGKEGYRYNAFSYLLFNWINKSYGLYLKLEIAEFISTQESMIKNYIKPVVEHVYMNGWGKTRPLDGILVQIALEQLRTEFPNKYVAIKRLRDGSRYIIINDFNKRA